MCDIPLDVQKKVGTAVGRQILPTKSADHSQKA
jgi:hypothetical protein